MRFGKTIHDWNEAKGDSTLRLQYKLNPNSVVVDVGCFKGDWLKSISNLYSCKIFAYEPTTDGFESIKYLQSEKITIKNCGLFNEYKKIKISNNGNASSILTNNGTDEIEVLNIIDEMKLWGDVDLIKINIEGAEYELLEALIENNALNKFKNLQIQFHKFDFIKEPIDRRQKIRESLSKTHHITYDFDFIWENWEIN
jgi:FkbM family methyltransferase